MDSAARVCGRRSNGVHYAVDVPAGRTLAAWVRNRTDGAIVDVQVRASCADDCLGAPSRRVVYENTSAAVSRIYLVASTSTTDLEFFDLYVGLY